MPKAAHIKPTHKAIKQYHQALKDYREQRVTHEGALETAFQRLLADTAKLHHCTLIPKQKIRVGKNNIFPDGTVRDTLYDTRLGFWKPRTPMTISTRKSPPRLPRATRSATPSSRTPAAPSSFRAATNATASTSQTRL
jgi:hypothetical protein